MSSDSEKIENLTKRMDELVVIMDGIMEDLRQISASLRSLATSHVTQPAPPPIPQVSSAVRGVPQPPERSKVLEDIRMMFPDDLENLLGFEEKEEYVLIKPRQFLGSDNFSKIASIVRGAGGDYVSAGKSSHFRVPKRRD